MALTTAMATLIAGGLAAAAGTGGAVIASNQANKRADKMYDKETVSADELETAMAENPNRRPDFSLSGKNNILFPTNPNPLKRKSLLG
jgi:hypothetical protein